MDEVRGEKTTNPDMDPGAEEAESRVSRRGFLMGGVATIAAAALGGTALVRPVTAVAGATISERVVVADPSLCIGCLTCEVVCSGWHKEVGRSAMPRIVILEAPQVNLQAELRNRFPERSGYSPQACRQCYDPWCLPNCPVGALRVDPQTGNRYIDEATCINCGKCEVDCPLTYKGKSARTGQEMRAKRVRFDPDRGVYNKCDLCRGRAEGPICVERCPVNIAIRRGTVKAGNPCLDLKPSTRDIWEKLT